MEEIIRVGHNRLPVLIGPNGSVKREIQRRTKTKIDIDSHLGEVTISSDQSFFEVYTAKNIISAIARGFSPENAYYLLKEDYNLEIVSLEDYVKNTKQRHTQIKGRVIGREGRIKKLIETKFHCILSVYGKTVAIIGNEDRIKDAREAVEQILAGAKHSTVIKSIKRTSLLEGYKEVLEEEKIDDIDFSE
jgi:ribosomal RNA assembly protein